MLHRSSLISVNSDLWFGAATTLAGAALAGAISLALNRQQMRDARARRGEDEQRAKLRRSEDRRFTAYAEFATRARTYPRRNPSPGRSTAISQANGCP